MKVAVIGGAGNMGQRYCRILDHLLVEHIIVDIDTYAPDSLFSTITHIIIATPTASHVNDIQKYATFGVPILCEKPICKNALQLQGILDLKCDLRMINQYELYPVSGEGKTYYNYFKTGSDSLLWDCINIIGLAKGDVEIKNDSPIWDCWINGVRLHLCAMDMMYIRNIEDWLNYSYDNKAYIKQAHEKIFKLTGET